MRWLCRHSGDHMGGVFSYRTTAGRTNSSLYSEMIAGTAAQSAYVTLDQMVNNHTKIPSFSSSTLSGASSNKYKLNYNSSTGTLSLTITDTTGVLSGYNVVSNDGLSVTKSGNTLTVTSNAPFTDSSSLFE